jgi:hypothetical protein
MKRNEQACFATALMMTASGTRSKSPTQVPLSGAGALVSAALRIAPVRRAVMAMGRRKILNEAAEIGVEWDADVQALCALEGELEQLAAKLRDDGLVLPEYYLSPFHAYDDGNLGWMPAFEAEVSSRTVHAKHSEATPLEGDAYLRGNTGTLLEFRACAQGTIEKQRAQTPSN